MFLPWFVLTVAYLGQYALIMRNSLIDVMNDDFVQARRDEPFGGDTCGNAGGLDQDIFGISFTT
jgi:hypothetical protein